jgi:hypothetical protein
LDFRNWGLRGFALVVNFMFGRGCIVAALGSEVAVISVDMPRGPKPGGIH